MYVSPQVALREYKHPLPIVVKVETDWEAEEVLKLDKYFESAQGVPSPPPHVIQTIATALLAAGGEARECLSHFTKVYCIVYGLHTGIMFDWCAFNDTVRVILCQSDDCI